MAGMPKHSSDLDPVEWHCRRLGPEYVEVFSGEQIRRHVEILEVLSAREPLVVLVDSPREAETDRCLVTLTFLSFDYPHEFSALTGILSAAGLSIESGHFFTFDREPPSSSPRTSGRRRRKSLRLRTPPVERRHVIDTLSCRLVSDGGLGDCIAEVSRRLRSSLQLFEKGDPDSVETALDRIGGWVMEGLRQRGADPEPVMLPLDVRMDMSSERFTRMIVTGADTPAFLYTLGTAMRVHDLSIESVRVRTRGNQVEDEIDFTDRRGNPIRRPGLVERIRLSTLVTKHFTYFLDRAPDPSSALQRFELLLQEASDRDDEGALLALLSQTRVMGDLAPILGSSDFVWEDFVRLHYETLLPALGSFSGARDDDLGEVEVALEGVATSGLTYEEKRRVLNELKDRQTFLLDLRHILNPTLGFREFSRDLTRLAEAVVKQAVAAVYEHLVTRYGRPLSVGRLEAPLAILGLGKLGGAALGYASDIELLFVYSDQGETEGPERIPNQEFFSRMVNETRGFIKAKRDGVFQLDLRLRPHGESGPPACSLEVFCDYYGPGGAAHSYERLALVRMRAIAGDAELGARLERLRDEYLYAARSITLVELRELRAKQYKELSGSGRINAKFSSGALVDLEYTVQTLQVLNAKDNLSLRTPRIHDALAALEAAKIVSAQECRRLVGAYDFLRRLINALRMLRGSAKDLYLPDKEAPEFGHLARRMGYAPTSALDPVAELFADFGTHTAAVRTFVQSHLGLDSLPDSQGGNTADVVLFEEMETAQRNAILRNSGFLNPQRAALNLKRLAKLAPDTTSFARSTVLACDMLRHEPDADMALNNWDRFVSAVKSSGRDVGAHYAAIRIQPRRFEILLGLFSRSQFLADTLIHNPEFFDWVTSPEQLHAPITVDLLLGELRDIARAAGTEKVWLTELGRFRARQMLRIGTRDMCLRAPLKQIALELSVLAEVIIEAVLERVWERLRNEGAIDAELDTDPAELFAVLALGKLGGSELNYSSDVDLLAAYDDERLPKNSDRREAIEKLFVRVMQGLGTALSAETAGGRLYRVDLRLRPYGSAGKLVTSLSRLVDYYSREAALWEIQALLKLRAVAGDRETAEKLQSRLGPLLQKEHDPDAVRESIRRMRDRSLSQQTIRRPSSTDVKVGLGGLRDVEFMVQGLQLLSAWRFPEVLGGNTLQALERLRRNNILDSRTTHDLREDYIFLRRLEHYLQILHDRQTHVLPKPRAELEALAKRMLGPQATAANLVRELEERNARVRKNYLSFVEDRGFGS